MIHTFTAYCTLSQSYARQILDNLGVSKRKSRYYGKASVTGIANIKLWSRGDDYGAVLMVEVNPAKLLYGFDAFETVTPDVLDDLTIAFAMAIENATGEEGLPALPDWQVHRIDFGIDIFTANLDWYLRLLNKGDKPRCFKEKYNWRKGSCRWDCKAVNVNVYDKAKQMKDRGKSPELIAQAQSILRFEIQCKSPKVGYLRKKNGLDDRSLKNFFCEEYAQAVLMEYCERAYKTGDYYKLSGALKRMKKLGISSRRLSANQNVIRAIAQTRSISEARRQLSESGITISRTRPSVRLKYSPEQFRRNCKSLAELGINPVVIAKHWDVDYLPSVFHLLEEAFCGNGYADSRKIA